MTSMDTIMGYPGMKGMIDDTSKEMSTGNTMETNEQIVT